jgi:hypothetical protein
MLWGCRIDAPRAGTTCVSHGAVLLARLTSVKESKRFRAMNSAMEKVNTITVQQLEAALTGLKKKNVSTLIYVYLKTNNATLYNLNPPAKMALENCAGAFPNIACYYARVKPSSGQKELLRLYRSHFKERMAICLALGEMPDQKAHEFLLAEARAIKAEGGGIVAHLCGLKRAPEFVAAADIQWFLEQKLDREEIIALSAIKVPLTDNQLQALWRSSAVKRNFTIERVLGDPEEYFDTLCWIVKQYLDTNDVDTVRRFMLSDNLRSTSSPRVRKFRNSVLKKIQNPEAKRGT